MIVQIFTDTLEFVGWGNAYRAKVVRAANA